MSKEVAVLFAPGFETIEALTPCDLLFRAGIECDRISITDKTQVVSSHRIPIECNLRLEDAVLDDYEMIVLPGGLPGTSNLEANQRLTQALIRFNAQKKQLAAICAAPSILAKIGLLKGRNDTANPAFQAALEAGGAILQTAAVVRDDNILTSQGAGTAMAFALEIVRYFGGDEVVEKVKKGVVLS